MHSIDITTLSDRLQRLTPPSDIISDFTPSPDLFVSYSRGVAHFEPKVIDTFAPRPELSPTSSMSSSDASDSSLMFSPEDAFFATRSRVVRLYNLPAMAESFLSAVFLPHNTTTPNPVTMWELTDEFAAGRRDSVWAVFRTHEEASAALLLSGRAMSVTTALESDLEPFHKLHRVLLASSSILDLHPPSSMPEVEYTLSTNPPNPKTSFRLGDWICSSPNCAAHNFGRNLACIGCGCPRASGANGSGTPTHQQHQHQQHPSSNVSTRAMPSPRFSSPSANVTYYSSAPPPSQSQTQQQQPHAHQQPAQHQQHGQHLTVPEFSQPQPSSSFGPTSSLPHVAAHPPKSSHPLLTPSGRAFAFGGKVQNISSDPLSPCIMYWPDNEPFPEQGQIRPNNLAGVAQPPILNTGNRGPISHQPGDWICQKCNYLNWRRRKVCQTCLPYAEGNGDSISAAVQAERIALLTSVLAQTQGSSGSSNLSVPGGSSPTPTHAAPRSHSLTPPQGRRPVIELSPSRPHRTNALHSLAPAAPTRSVHRSQSHLSLGQQFASQSPQFTTAPSPIYQTSGHAHAQQQQQQQQPRQSSPLSPLYSTGPDVHHQHVTHHRNTINFIPNAHHRQQQNDNINVNLHLNANAHVHGNNIIHNNATTTAAAAAHNLTHFTTPHVTVQAPAPLLPSFLQDIVQSPALSPTSTTTSSADLSSVEEYEDLVTSPRAIFPRARGDSGSSDMISQNSPIANIWRLDGEESKSLSAFPLPNRQELAVGARKTSREVLRV